MKTAEKSGWNQSEISGGEIKCEKLYRYILFVVVILCRGKITSDLSADKKEKPTKLIWMEMKLFAQTV